MVLYFIKTTFQLLECIAHKIVENPDEEAVLLINSGHVYNYPNYKELQQFGFKKIIVYSTGRITSPDTKNENELVNNIIKYYDQLFLDNNLSICDFSKVYVFAALRFSIYLVEKNVKFELFEDAPGAFMMVGSWVLWRENTDKIDKRKLGEKYKLTNGENECISKLCFDKSKGVPDSNKAHEYNINCKLKQIKEIDMLKILNFFGENCANTNLTTDNLILFRHCCKQDADFDNNQNELLEIVSDWFSVGGDIIIKTHPSDRTNYCLNPRVKWIKKQVPSELLPFITGEKIKNIIGVGTSAVNALYDKAYQVKYLSYDICNIMHFAARLFVSLKLLNSLNLDKYNITIFGLYTHITECFINCLINKESTVQWVNFSKDKNNIVIVDKLIWGGDEISCKEKIKKYMSESQDGIIVFVDSDKKFNFCEVLSNKHIDYIIPFNIRYSSVDGTYSKKTEYFYIWSKNQKVRKDIENFDYAKVLPYSNTIATVSTVRGDIKREIMESIQMKVLKYNI